jgi:hypothetical protein
MLNYCIYQLYHPDYFLSTVFFRYCTVQNICIPACHVTFHGCSMDNGTNAISMGSRACEFIVVTAGRAHLMSVGSAGSNNQMDAKERLIKKPCSKNLWRRVRSILLEYLLHRISMAPFRAPEGTPILFVGRTLCA